MPMSFVNLAMAAEISSLGQPYFRPTISAMADPQLSIGQSFGRYRVLEMVDKGGMGIVFRERTDFDTDEDADFIVMELVEGESLARSIVSRQQEYWLGRLADY